MAPQSKIPLISRSKIAVINYRAMPDDTICSAIGRMQCHWPNASGSLATNTSMLVRLSASASMLREVADDNDGYTKIADALVDGDVDVQDDSSVLAEMTLGGGQFLRHNTIVDALSQRKRTLERVERAIVLVEECD
eukprot:6200493-Pleurochrysis_carterae.AAC.3